MARQLASHCWPGSPTSRVMGTHRYLPSYTVPMHPTVWAQQAHPPDHLCAGAAAVNRLHCTYSGFAGPACKWTVTALEVCIRAESLQVASGNEGCAGVLLRNCPVPLQSRPHWHLFWPHTRVSANSGSGECKRLTPETAFDRSTPELSFFKSKTI